MSIINQTLSDSPVNNTGLYDSSLEKDNCGVGFITRKDGVQTHDVLLKGHEALCTIPHRGGMSAEGVGDGAGVSIDLSLAFFSRVTGLSLEAGRFGVGNFFLPSDVAAHAAAEDIIRKALADKGLEVLQVREVPVDNDAIRPAAVRYQLPIQQWIFAAPASLDAQQFDRSIYQALLVIEEQAYTTDSLAGLYPLSMSAHTQVLKGRLNSNEVIPYFHDLMAEDHAVHTMYFHTRFSTNTDPHPSMAQLSA